MTVANELAGFANNISNDTISNATLDSTNSFNFANDSISGDKINGGTISNATLASSVTFPAGHVIQTEYQYVAYNGTPTESTTTNVGSSVTVLYPCTKILIQIVCGASSPTIYAAYGGYSIGYSTNATISVSASSTVGDNFSFVGGDTANDGEQIYGTLCSSKLFIRDSGSPAYFDTGVTVQPRIYVGPVYGGSYFHEMGIHIFFIK